MKKGWIYALFASIFLGGTAFIASNQWYLGIAVGAVALILILFYLVPAIEKYGTLSRKRHECYLFIHGYLVTLSVCMSLEKSFDVATHSMGKDFHRLDETLSSMQAREKVEYLASYFESDLYRMFLSILHLYLDRGGDVLKLSSELTAEASRVEETAQAYDKQAIRKMMSFGFLWLMALIIVMFMRFGLSSFFSSMSASPMYLGTLGAFYGFMLLSFGIYCACHTGILPWKKRRKKEAKHETVKG